MLWPGWLCLALGLVMTVISMTRLLRRLRLFSRGVRVEGLVVGFRQSEQTSAPIVEFPTRSGTRERFRSPVFASHCPFHQGDTVSIVYDETHPQRAVIASYGVYTPVWGIIAGIVFIVFGLGLLNLIPGLHFHDCALSDCEGQSALPLPLQLLLAAPPSI